MTNNDCLITLAIPTYNNASTIKCALDSCLGQTDLGNCEILVVNNGSTDATKNILSDYKEHPAVRVVNNQQTVGMWENHNVCLEQANGSYILFCHSDDKLDDDGIAILKAHLASRNYPKKYICWGHSLYRDYSEILARHGYRTGQLFAGEDSVSPFLVRGLSPSGTCYTKDILDHDGFIQSNHRLAPSDSSTMVYLAMKGYRFEMIQQMIVCRTEASTAIFQRNSVSRQSRLDAYCETYNHLIESLDKNDVKRIFLRTLRFNYLPYSFMYFIAAHFPSETRKKIVKTALRHPSVLTNELFWRVLIRTLSKKAQE